MTKAKSIIVWLTALALLAQVAYGAFPFNWLSKDDQPLPSLAPMLEHTQPAVVNIATKGHVAVRNNPLLMDPFFRRFFDLPDMPLQQREVQSLGSGVIIDAKKGLIITNNHVIDHADTITVSLNDGRQFDAKLIGHDKETDVALIQIKADNLTALPLADSDQLRVGDFVVAIGNPFGLGQTVTSGIISALGRSGLGIEGYENFIQTDASINPGNSGGALVNLRGELIGINTAIFSPGEKTGNIGIGFAIPSNLVKQISNQLIQFGQVRRAHLGIQLQGITPELAQAFGLKTTHGAVITQVMSGSTADKAGLKAGDIILAINGQKLINLSSLKKSIGLIMVGQKITLSVLRDGKTQTITTTVTQPHQTSQQGHVHPKLSGATFGDIEPDSPYYGKVDGVMIYSVTPGSPAARAGLRSGDIIVSVDKVPVKNLDQFKSRVTTTRPLLLNIQRQGRALFLLLR